ncbi:MAG: hypothetical protein KC777_10045 [Cyanobacteria bacterium HKST-UBA02]|nr:hypothetical protein [Cyanobacteria bacterium HKST-UBA02]
MQLRLVLVITFTILGFGFGINFGWPQSKANEPESTELTKSLDQLIEFAGKGRIFPVGLSDSRKLSDLLPKDRQIVEAIKTFAPGRTSSEIRKVLGEPRLIESSVPIKEWPKSANESERVSLYMVGPGGWGHVIALCYSSDLCTSVIELNSFQIVAYESWKSDSRLAVALGKNEDEILAEFGEPDFHRKSRDGSCDEEWSYNELEGAGIWLKFINSKCVTANRSLMMH